MIKPKQPGTFLPQEMGIIKKTTETRNAIGARIRTATKKPSERRKTFAKLDNCPTSYRREIADLVIRARINTIYANTSRPNCQTWKS
jgi:hypothetical protein